MENTTITGALCLEALKLKSYVSNVLFTHFKERDAQKRKACLSRGITLIEIPYWWDRSKSQILAELHKNRPDVVEQAPPGTKSIPTSLPSYRPRKKSNRAGRN